MKPFDLEAALAGEPVVLRNGNKAYVTQQLKKPKFAMEELTGYRELTGGDMNVNWRKDGLYISGGIRHRLDIIGMWEELPKKVKIGDLEYQKPEIYPLPRESIYYVPCLLTPTLPYAFRWMDTGEDIKMLRRNLVHKTKAAAVKHAKVLIAIGLGEASFED